MAEGKKDGICLETASVSPDAGAGGMATQAKEEEKGTKIAAVAGSGRGCDCENLERYDFGPVEGPKEQQFVDSEARQGKIVDCTDLATLPHLVKKG